MTGACNLIFLMNFVVDSLFSDVDPFFWMGGGGGGGQKLEKWQKILRALRAKSQYKTLRKNEIVYV